MSAKKRRWWRSSFVTVMIGNGANSILGLLAGLLLAKLLDRDGRGVLAIALVWPGLALNVLGLGVRNSSAFFAARYPDRRPEVLRHAVNHAIISTCLIVGSGVIGTLLFVERPALRLALIIAFSATPFAIATGVARGALQSTNLRLWSTVRLVQPLVYFTVIAVLGATGRLTIVGGAWAYFASLALAGIAAWKVSPTEIGPRARGEGSLGRPMLRYGIKSTFAQTAQTVNVRLDIAVLGLVLAPAEVGAYAVASSLSQYVVPLSTAAAPWVFPQIARRAHLAKNRAVARRAMKITFGIALACAASGAVVGPIVLVRFLGDEWKDSIVPLWILLVGSVFQSLSFVLVSIANALERPEFSARTEAVAAISTVALLWPMVHFFGITGAAITTLVAYTTSALYLNVLVTRVFDSPGSGGAVVEDGAGVVTSA